MRWQFVRIACINTLIIHYKCDGYPTLLLITLRAQLAMANESSKTEISPHVIGTGNQHFHGQVNVDFGVQDNVRNHIKY